MPRSRSFLVTLVLANLGLFGLGVALTSPSEAPLEAPMPAFDASNELRTLAQVRAEAPRERARQCRLWGPAQSPEEFALLAERLRAEGGFPEIQESVVLGNPDFLVFLADLGSRQRAQQTAKELASIDIDSYLIDRDEGESILSVGVFSQKEHAERQLERMQSLGYAAGLEPMERNQTVYRLSAHVMVDSADFATSTSACQAIAQGR